MSKEKKVKIDYHQYFRNGIVGNLLSHIALGLKVKILSEFIDKKFGDEFQEFFDTQQENVDEALRYDLEGIEYSMRFKDVDRFLEKQMKEKEDGS